MSAELDDATLEQRRAAAAEWFARMHGPDAEASAGAFAAWLSQDAMNAQIYQRQAQLWDQSKFLNQSETVRARDLSRVAVWHRRPGVWRAAGLGAAATMIVLAIGLALYRPMAAVMAPAALAISTGIGEIRTVALADGSRVMLDSASRVQVDFTSSARNVRLVAGAARFDVTRDDKRRFAVITSRGSLSANGATFDISQTSGLLKIATLRGTVTFSARPGLATPASIYIAAGQSLTSSSSDGVGKPVALSPDADAWTRGMTSFDGERLGDAVEEFNRHNKRKILIGDPSIAELRITGAFHVDDPSRFARAVADMLLLSLRERGDGSVELRLRKKA